MFDLDREIVSWCRRTYPWPHYRKSQIAELEDHLHCTVENLVERGLTNAEAFERAVAQLGEAESLKNEYQKNWNRFSGAVRYVEARPMQFGSAVVVTGALLGGMLVVYDAESFQWTRNMIVAIYSMPFEFFRATS